MTLIYDRSFEGFLSLVYEVYYKKLKPKKIVYKKPNELFLDDYMEIPYNEIHTQKVFEALKIKFSKKDFNTILNIFMCDSNDFEIHLLNYIILGFKDKKELNNINIPSIFYIKNLEKELFRNIHKMEGFLRFKELEDKTLYAVVENKFNLVYFLGKHFFKRLNNQKYIIHDINRKIAFIKNDDYLGIENIANFQEPKISKNEDKFSKLWTHFFNSISISTRENKKCQNSMVPLIYRVYMNEFH